MEFTKDGLELTRQEAHGLRDILGWTFRYQTPQERDQYREAKRAVNIIRPLFCEKGPNDENITGNDNLEVSIRHMPSLKAMAEIALTNVEFVSAAFWLSSHIDPDDLDYEQDANKAIKMCEQLVAWDVEG